MILMTGAKGLLGTELLKYFDKNDVIATDKDDYDILNIEKKFDDVDIIVHCAAYTDVEKAENDKVNCFKTNVIGTKNLLEMYPYVKFIYISSEYAYNPVNF